MYVYVCMCVCMCVYVCMYVYAYVYVCMHVCMHARMHVARSMPGLQQVRMVFYMNVCNMPSCIMTLLHGVDFRVVITMYRSIVST